MKQQYTSRACVAFHVRCSRETMQKLFDLEMRFLRESYWVRSHGVGPQGDGGVWRIVDIDMACSAEFRRELAKLGVEFVGEEFGS